MTNENENENSGREYTTVTVSTSGGIVLLDVWADEKDREWISFIAYKNLLEQAHGVNREIDSLRKGKTLSVEELEEITRIRREHQEMKDELGKLAIFIREQYKREIELGQHANIRTAVDAACMYMGRERMATNG